MNFSLGASSGQSRAEPLPEEHVRFYAAAVVLGLEYMQNHDLVWRCASTICCHRQLCAFDRLLPQLSVHDDPEKEAETSANL